MALKLEKDDTQLLAIYEQEASWNGSQIWIDKRLIRTSVQAAAALFTYRVSDWSNVKCGDAGRHVWLCPYLFDRGLPETCQAFQL